MKTIIITLFLLLSCVFRSYAGTTSVKNDTICYHYYGEDVDNIKTASMYDVVLVLIKNDAGVQCWFYGTSDDFDEVREGYFPGYTVLQAKSFSCDDAKMEIMFDATNSYFFSQPIELGLYTMSEVKDAGYKAWIQPSQNCWKGISLSGVDYGDYIILTNTMFSECSECSRKFYKEPYSKVKSLYKRSLIPSEYEQVNNENFEGENKFFIQIEDE